MNCFRSISHHNSYTLRCFISSCYSRPVHSWPFTSCIPVIAVPCTPSISLLRACKTISSHNLGFRRLRREYVVSRGGALGFSLMSSFSSGCASSTEVVSTAAAAAAAAATTASEVMLRGESDQARESNQAQDLKVLEAALGTPFSDSPQVPPPKPLLIVLSGSSGVGKDAVIKRLQEVRKELHFIVTATTRQKRPGEAHGIDYYFVSKEEFQKLIEDKELLEFALVYGDYKGIPKQQVRDCISKGFDAILRVDVQGAATIRSILGSDAVFIFLVAESEVALVQRLVGRKTEPVDKMVLRIATAREELKHLHEFDYVVVNADGQLEKTVNTICSIIDAEKARVQQRIITI